MRAFAAIVVALLCASFAGEARAQSVFIPPDSDDPELLGTQLAVVDAGSPVPANGSFLLWVSEAQLGVEESPLVQVSRVEGASMRTFGGSARHVESSYWAWTASEPLEPGEYFVAIAHAVVSSSASAMIEVVGDAVLDVPSFTSEAYTKRHDVVTDYLSCGSSELPSRVDGQAFVYVDLAFDAGAEVYHQYLYRLVAVGATEGMPFRSWDALLPIVGITQQAEEYCVRIEAMDLATGTVHSYPGEVCAPHGNIGELGVRMLPVEDRSLSYFGCPVPPLGYEEQWCRVNEPCIEAWARNETLARASGCFNYFELCPDAPRPDAGASEPDASVMDAGEVRDAAAQGDAGRERPIHSTGCGCSAVRASEPPSLKWLALLAFVSAAWRASFARRGA